MILPAFFATELPVSHGYTTSHTARTCYAEPSVFLAYRSCCLLHGYPLVNPLYIVTSALAFSFPPQLVTAIAEIASLAVFHPQLDRTVSALLLPRLGTTAAGTGALVRWQTML